MYSAAGECEIEPAGVSFAPGDRTPPTYSNHKIERLIAPYFSSKDYFRISENGYVWTGSCWKRDATGEVGNDVVIEITFDTLRPVNLLKMNQLSNSQNPRLFSIEYWDIQNSAWQTIPCTARAGAMGNGQGCSAQGRTEARPCQQTPAIHAIRIGFDVWETSFGILLVSKAMVHAF